MTMMRSSLAAMLLLLLFGAAAAAQDLGDKAINNPAESWGTWGKVKIETFADTKVPGGAAKRVTIVPKPANPWDVGGYITITKPVKKGDVLLLAFWARAAAPPAGNDFVQTTGRIFENAPPGTSISPETTFLIGREWSLQYANGTADKDYPVGALGVGMVLGTAEQVIEFGPAYVADFGPGYDLTKLPGN